MLACGRPRDRETIVLTMNTLQFEPLSCIRQVILVHVHLPRQWPCAVMSSFVHDTKHATTQSGTDPKESYVFTTRLCGYKMPNTQ